MAVRTLFYPDGETVYQASDFMTPWDRLLNNGVFSQGDFNISADSPADLAVSVSAGCAKVSGGYIVVSDSTVSVPIEANTSGYNRRDYIVIEVDSVNNKTSIKAVKGIPSSSPVLPTLASNQLPLATVYVGNNASAIDDNTVFDCRTFLDDYTSVIKKNHLNGWTDSGKNYTCDTGGTVTIARGSAYQALITCKGTPTVIAGTPDIVTVLHRYDDGDKHYYYIVPIGHSGQEAGIYINGIRQFIARVK